MCFDPLAIIIRLMPKTYQETHTSCMGERSHFCRLCYKSSFYRLYVFGLQHKFENMQRGGGAVKNCVVPLIYVIISKLWNFNNGLECANIIAFDGPTDGPLLSLIYTMSYITKLILTLVLWCFWYESRTRLRHTYSPRKLDCVRSAALLTKQQSGDQINTNEMSEVCSTYGRGQVHTGF